MNSRFARRVCHSSLMSPSRPTQVQRYILSRTTVNSNTNNSFCTNTRMKKVEPSAYIPTEGTPGDPGLYILGISFVLIHVSQGHRCKT
jgi:hypothetical protein